MEISRTNIKHLLRISCLIILIACTIFGLYLYQNGYLKDSETLQTYINSFGLMSTLVFIVVEIAQAVFAFIPGGITCIAGVVLFGKLKGFLLNYIGMILGSIFAFAIGRNWGRLLIEMLFKKELIDKYDTYTSNQKRFDLIFSFVILLPFMPDDLLCYLAGTTKMSLKKFMFIILLTKIPTISMYSLGVYYFLENLF